MRFVHAGSTKYDLPQYSRRCAPLAAALEECGSPQLRMLVQAGSSHVATIEPISDDVRIGPGKNCLLRADQALLSTPDDRLTGLMAFRHRKIRSNGEVDRGSNIMISQ